MSAITTTFTIYWVSYAYDEYLQESRMREIRKSGSTRGSNGIGNSPPVALYSTASQWCSVTPLLSYRPSSLFAAESCFRNLLDLGG